MPAPTNLETCPTEMSAEAYALLDLLSQMVKVLEVDADVADMSYAEQWAVVLEDCPTVLHAEHVLRQALRRVDATHIAVLYPADMCPDYQGLLFRVQALFSEAESLTWKRYVPMSDTTNFDSLQARLSADGERIVRQGVLFNLLATFDPQPGDRTLDYAGLIERVQIVLSQEVAALEEGTKSSEV